ncbi:chitin synthase (Chitin-UDP-GlcNac-transferase) [Achlya hypogyna]|uniref:chitin synthase n=1 Tax=Achlya hypogyna TaxID=1202772 RepID=A0A1V9YEX9_ACHHY|nr:chitin synthase (Chitin-UDP-GlcNac-transferase) [Achlya hypogyna]
MVSSQLSTGLPTIARRPSTRSTRVGSHVRNDNDCVTTVDAFRYIERGVRAEYDMFYSEAINCFVNAGECLLIVAEQNDDEVSQMLLAKSQEVIGWAEELSIWLENGRTGPLPSRNCRGIQIPFSKEFEGGEHYEEATELSYTPVATVNPINFTLDGYRMQCITRGRKPTMMLVITMYNEDGGELAQTLRKVCNNVKYMQRNALPGYEGDDAWQNIVVCIVSDGRTKANPSATSFLRDIGVFNEDAMTIFSSGAATQMHLFERTVRLAKDPHNKKSVIMSNAATVGSDYPPLQMVYALKEHNAGKLNSHLWFFNAFCNQVDPEYNILLDVGTLPTKAALYKLLATLEMKSDIGGVCGEIAVSRPIPNLWNFVIATQHFEYKVSNLLDKATESCFGFVSVLPGAFSAYRFAAIKGAPLQAYFKSLTTDMADLGPFYGNMYLAEDRILCFELLARTNGAWKLKYIKDAIARTDVPSTLVDLMAQRRRWLNGSFFAMLYSIVQWGRLYSHTNHSVLTKAGLLIQYFQLLVQLFFGWFMCGFFYLSVYYVVFTTLKKSKLPFWDSEEWYDDHHSMAMSIFNIVYAFLIMVQIVFGLGNKPKHVQWLYTSLSCFYALVVFTAVFFSICSLSSHNGMSPFNIVLLAATFGVYFIAAAFHFELHHVVFTFVQYLIMLPTTINILMIYAFCNIQDLSWGTKGLGDSAGHGPAKGSGGRLGSGGYADLVAQRKAAEAQQRQDAVVADQVKRRFDSFRSYTLLFWLISNALLIMTCIYFVGANVFLPSLFLFIALFNVTRLLGSVAFVVATGRDWLLLKLCLCSGGMAKRKEKKTRAHEQEAFGALDSAKVRRSIA